jgi:molybdopterin-containing oxidoreductase family iron-sulfur binding subunit
MKWAQGQSVVSRVKFTKPEGLELALIPSINLRDGSSANNPYIQELPDPITKITWDNYVGVSPKFAAKMGLNENLIDGEAKTKELPSDFGSDLVEVTVNGQSIVLPVFVQTGLDENVVSIQLGYGRTSAGQIGSGVGKNAFVFAASNAGQTQFRGMSVSLKKVSGRYELASTQKQFDLQGRDSDILQQHSLKDFLAHSGEHKKHPSADLYNEKEWVYPGHRWGMAIDLNSCTGCNACVVACYTENNVSTVGRDEVIMGRHQAWMRLDLYHSGDAGNPVSAFEPMLCQQCANAPCETVCPVLATVHSSDGLNDMSYNRCVGTRYCANNCPYKVRRFNWFQYSDKLANKVTKVDPLPLMINPDVSVRTRGVMEKCTFCVQRIRNGVDETVQSRMKRVPDGHIKTACQQSCPADAIVFGDLNDPESEVSKLAHAKGGFKVLEILNTKPSVTYLPRIRNRDSV